MRRRSLRQIVDSCRQVVRSPSVRRAVASLKTEVAIAVRHGTSLSLASQYRGARGLKLNIACGPNPKPGWVNIDLFCPGLQLDMREAMPFDDASCDTVYSEHFVEHLGYPTEALRFMQESYRVLAPGGRFSVGVPDTEAALLAYAGVAYPTYFADAKASYHPPRCVTKAEHIDYHFRQDGEHQFAYDFETMQKCLASSGFTRIERRGFDPTIDSPSRRAYTLYVDAVRA